MRGFSALILGLIFSVSAFSQEGFMQLASDSWPPFTSDYGGKAYSTELVSEALKRIDYSDETTYINFESVIPGIQDGMFDGSAALWRTEEREEFILFSDPYLQNKLLLVGQKGADVSATSLSELSEKRIGVVGTYAYGEEVDYATEVVFISGRSDQENLEKLLAGELDYILIDELIIQYELTYHSEEVEENLEVGELPLFTKSLHFGLSKSYPNAEEIMKQFNNAIFEMISDGTYNEILELNWITADVDGDGIEEYIHGSGAAGVERPKSSYDILFEESRKNPTSASDRYYINGQMYNGWQSVPAEYRAPVNTDPNAGQHGFGLHFKF